MLRVERFQKLHIVGVFPISNLIKYRINLLDLDRMSENQESNSQKSDNLAGPPMNQSHLLA